MRLQFVGLQRLARFAKRVIACTTVISSANLAVNGQIVLNTGEVFTYEFSNLAFTENVPVANGTPGCALIVRYEQTVTGNFRFETFENSLSDTPFISDTALNINSPSFWYSSASHWQDLQGVVRFTVLNGPVVIDSFRVESYIPRDALSVDLYGITIVPEPSVSLLFLFGLSIGGLWWFLGSKVRRFHCTVPEMQLNEIGADRRQADLVGRVRPVSRRANKATLTRQPCVIGSRRATDFTVGSKRIVRSSAPTVAARAKVTRG